MPSRIFIKEKRKTSPTPKNVVGTGCRARWSERRTAISGTLHVASDTSCRAATTKGTYKGSVTGDPTDEEDSESREVTRGTETEAVVSRGVGGRTPARLRPGHDCLAYSLRMSLNHKRSIDHT